MASPGANQRGIIAIVCCMAAYTCNDALMKQIIGVYPIGQAIFVRGVFSVLLIGAVAVALGHGARIGASMTPRLASRSVFDGLSTAFFITALAHMPMANVAAILQIAPLVITALSVLVYRESVGWRRWGAIAVGFTGALMVVKPVPDAFDAWALVAVASALTSAGRELQNRRIAGDVPTLVIALWGAVGITLIGATFAFYEDWRMFDLRSLGMVFIASCFVAIAITLMASAYRDVDLSVVAPFRYSYLLTSAVAGYLAFGERPDAWSAAGALLIVAAGLYALHREAQRRRDLTARSVPAA